MTDRYLFSRTKALEHEYRRVTRRQQQASLAAILSIAYDEYHQMCLCRTCSESDNTFPEAEMMADTFGEIFGMDIPTEAFLPSEKRADDAIEHYRKYASYREMMQRLGYEEKDLDAFCRQVEHGAWKIGLTSFFAYNSVGYVYSMRGVYDYLCGSVSREQMVKSLIIFMPPKIRPMTDAQVRRFLRTMFRAVREFQDIAEKRRKRRKDK